MGEGCYNCFVCTPLSRTILLCLSNLLFTFHATCTPYFTHMYPIFPHTLFLVLAFNLSFEEPFFLCLYTAHQSYLPIITSIPPNILPCFQTHVFPPSHKAGFSQVTVCTRVPYWRQNILSCVFFSPSYTTSLNCLLTLVWIRSLWTKEGVFTLCIYQIFEFVNNLYPCMHRLLKCISLDTSTRTKGQSNLPDCSMIKGKWNNANIRLKVRRNSPEFFTQSFIYFICSFPLTLGPSPISLAKTIKHLL